MFTGVTEILSEIIEHTESAGTARLTIICPEDWTLSVGQSIAVSGTCLTVIEHKGGQFKVEVMPETLMRTTLADSTLRTVNLERALLASGRFEGHIVQGHIDTVGKIESVSEGNGISMWEFSFPAEYQENVVEKGSIAVDGVSLTIVSVGDGRCRVGLIPHTLTVTTFGSKQVGDEINLEFDIIGKYFMNKYHNHG